MVYASALGAQSLEAKPPGSISCHNGDPLQLEIESSQASGISYVPVSHSILPWVLVNSLAVQLKFAVIRHLNCITQCLS